MNNSPEPPTYGRVPKSRKDEGGEYGPGKSGIVICEDCGATYHKKSWKHDIAGHKNLKDNSEVRFVLCPACKMKKEKLFEGEVIIGHIPASVRDELVGLIENIEARARKRDPMDRIIEMRSRGKTGLIIHTTENQLAASIGKQIVRAHKGASVDIQWSDKESIARVRVSF